MCCLRGYEGRRIVCNSFYTHDPFFHIKANTNKWIRARIPEWNFQKLQPLHTFLPPLHFINIAWSFMKIYDSRAGKPRGDRHSENPEKLANTFIKSGVFTIKQSVHHPNIIPVKIWNIMINF